MQKTQLILIVVAIVIIGGLYSLPRVVVSNPASQNNAAKSAQKESKNTTENTNANAQEHTHADGTKHTGTHAEDEGKDAGTHQKGLSESQKNRLPSKNSYFELFLKNLTCNFE